MKVTKICEWLPCGKQFEPRRQANRRSRYCSATCRLKAHRSRRMIVSRTPVGTLPQYDRFRRSSEPQAAAHHVLKPNRASFELPAGYVYSDWQPCLPSDWRTLSDLPIPDFLKRANHTE